MRGLSLTLLSSEKVSIIMDMYRNDLDGTKYLGGYNQDQIVALVDGRQRLIWIVSEDELPIGFIDLQKEGKKGYFAYFVAKSYRRKGYGIRLLELIEEQSEKRGILFLEGSFESENIASQKALEKTGFLIATKPDKEGMITATKHIT